jgi:CDP-4-dehydro-6-deoxyglucose reductase, E1
MEVTVGKTLDFWLTLGIEGETFQKVLAALLDVSHSLLVNSGSSAILVAISGLTSAKLSEARRVKPGDGVITVASGCPTSVAPIVRVGAVPMIINSGIPSPPFPSGQMLRDTPSGAATFEKN